MMVVRKKRRKIPPESKPYKLVVETPPPPPKEAKNPIHEAIMMLGNRLQMRRSHSGESLIYFLDGNPISAMDMLKAAGFTLTERRR